MRCGTIGIWPPRSLPSNTSCSYSRVFSALFQKVLSCEACNPGFLGKAHNILLELAKNGELPTFCAALFGGRHNSVQLGLSGAKSASETAVFI
jgi:hypothetical protein